MGDPWRDVRDLDGRQHYRILGVARNATDAEIRHSYRQRARTLHPDKGGDPASFAQLREAFEILTDPARRSVYDRWAGDVHYKYIPGVTRRAPGGEEELFRSYEKEGIQCDPATQLVVTCEVCRRPATKECWTCKMAICDFCTLKQHWKDAHPLHWPLIASKAFRTRLARSEMERKVEEDAKRYVLQDPNYRSQQELQVIRAFKHDAERIYRRSDASRHYNYALGRFYLWTQTDSTVIVAIHVPTGYADREMKFDSSGGRLRIQAEGFLPVIDRQMDIPLSMGHVETYATIDNRFHVLAMPKEQPCETYSRLFVGDSDGCRRFEPIYDLYDTDDEVLVELRVPFWIDSDDVAVQLTEKDIQIWVRNQLHIHRTFWTEHASIAENREEMQPAIDVSRCSWCLEDETVHQGDRVKTLSVSMVRPEPSASEMQWKKGIRQDNKVRKLEGGSQLGIRFFVDDEDEFRLGAILQAASLKLGGQAYVPPASQGGEIGFYTNSIEELSAETQTIYRQLFMK